MKSPRVPRRAFVAALAAGVFAEGCQRSGSEPRPSAEPRELCVFAASSLRDAFTELGREFEREHEGVHVVFNFAGTQELRAQLEHGARADVFASADPRHTNELLAAERILAPVSFARNEPVVIVPSHSGGVLGGFGDLPSATRLVLGAPEVPIGHYTQRILERANQQYGADFRSRVEAKVVSRELNVRQVLAKVSLGEADAGIVYRTDANAASERVRILAIPAELNLIADYPIAIVADAPQPELAVEWVNWVRSEVGRKLLLRAGFLAPEAPAQRK